LLPTPPLTPAITVPSLLTANACDWFVPSRKPRPVGVPPIHSTASGNGDAVVEEPTITPPFELTAVALLSLPPGRKPRPTRPPVEVQTKA
jgi:hypothetical protein